jgi:hypothetical protein
MLMLTASDPVLTGKVADTGGEFRYLYEACCENRSKWNLLSDHTRFRI